jgi:hypothetical protein
MNAQKYHVLDSVYTYEGEDRILVKKTSFNFDCGKCDEGMDCNTDGMMVENIGIWCEEGLMDLNKDGILSENERYKIYYIYYQKGSLIEKEALPFYSTTPDEWVYGVKQVTGYKESNPTVMDYIHFFAYEDEQWTPTYKRTTKAYNKTGLPVEYIDTFYYSTGYDVRRIEVQYYENDMYRMFTYFDPTAIPEEPWTLSEKQEFLYNERDKLKSEIKHKYKNGDWNYQSTTDYEYDDTPTWDYIKDFNVYHLISEIERDEKGIVRSVYYKNIYSIQGSNDAPFTVNSTIYPNPVRDILYVTIENANHAIITLTNATGSMISRQETNRQTTILSVQSLTAGYYFLTVETQKGVYTHKVIVR